MQKALLLFVSSFIFISASAQDSWSARYNGPASKQDGVPKMVVKADSVYVTGLSEGKKGNRDYVVIKYNAKTGAQYWVARYNGTGNSSDLPEGIDVDSEGNVYVTGGSIGANGTYDFATVKYSGKGVQLWVRRFEGPRNDIAKDIRVDGSDVYVTGFTDAANQFNGNAIKTVKYSSAGTELWEDTLNSTPDIYDGSATNREEGTSLALDNLKNIYITGSHGSKGMVTLKYSFDGTTYTHSWSKHGYVSQGSGRKVLIDANGNALVTGFSSETIKYAPDGSELWNKSFISGSGVRASFQDLALDASGNAYVTGSESNSTARDNYLTVCFRADDGAQQWVSRYYGQNNAGGFARAIAYSATGNFVYVTGFAANNASRTSVPNIGTVKYDAGSGLQLAAWLYDGIEKQGSSGFAIAVDYTGTAYSAGETTYKGTYIDITTLKHGPGSASTMVTSTSILDENPASTRPASIKTYPSPVSSTGFVEFNLVSESQVRLSLVDNLGRELKVIVAGKRSAGVHRVAFDRTGVAAGTYYYRLQANDRTLVKRVVLVGK